MEERVNYVVACWAGPRRFMHPSYRADRTIFLKLHLRQLELLQHDLAKITIVVNEFSDPQFDAFVGAIDGTTVRKTQVRVLRRPNVGMSYGAWADVFALARESFSHYIWIEDDYVFVSDDFDIKLLAMMEASDCDYLCGFAADFGSGRHAAISNGLVRSKILSRVCRRFERLPHAATEVDYLDNYNRGQIEMSLAIQEVGGKLSDITEFGWCAPWADMGHVRFFSAPGPALIVPAEILLPEESDADASAPADASAVESPIE